MTEEQKAKVCEAAEEDLQRIVGRFAVYEARHKEKMMQRRNAANKTRHTKSKPHNYRLQLPIL